MQQYDYIVIGSGFGGSVSAMRLSEKGYSVAVLEKGREFQAKDFPKTNWNIRKYLWAPLIKCFGFQKITFFRRVMILSGTGVGGGSLVYANTLMFPPDEFFNNKVWSRFKDWKSVLSPFYQTAGFMLGVAPNPWSHKADKVLREVAKDLGKQDSAENVKVGVYFGDPNKQVDPYFSGLGPLRSGCTSCAGCMVGCRYNAKNTLDKNYLFFAKKFGAKILPKTLVKKIEFKNDQYYIHTERTGAWFFKKRNIFQSRGVVFSGGVLGTMDLLLKQKYQYRTMPNISDKLGENIRTNSEMLCGITTKNTKMNEGVAISSIMNPDKDTHVEICKYPNGSSFMKLLTLPYVNFSRTPTRFFRSLGKIIFNPLEFLKMYLFTPWAENSVIFLIMQHLDSSMKMSLKRWPFSRLVLEDSQKVPAFIPSGANVMERYAKKVDGFAQSAFPEMFDIPATAHILGGNPMGKDASEGVVSPQFELFNYPNAYVLDGSIVPCNIGVNPSFTITALSEYAMSNIPAKEGNQQKSLNQLISEQSV